MTARKFLSIASALTHWWPPCVRRLFAVGLPVDTDAGLPTYLDSMTILYIHMRAIEATRWLIRYFCRRLDQITSESRLDAFGLLELASEKWRSRVNRTPIVESNSLRPARVSDPFPRPISCADIYLWDLCAKHAERAGRKRREREKREYTRLLPHICVFSSAFLFSTRTILSQFSRHSGSNANLSRRIASTASTPSSSGR